MTYLPGSTYNDDKTVVLYAQWEPITYTVRFYDSDTLLDSKVLSYDETGTLSCSFTPEKKGYVMSGWSTVDGGIALFSDGTAIKNLSSVNGDVINYYIVWEREESECPNGGEHTYTAETVAPTCTEKGYTVYTCSKCGDTYNDDYVDALGHSYGELIIETEPTCTEDGLKYKLCSACGDRVEEAIPATGHSYTDTVVAPTCTEQGYTRHTCSECGNNYTDSYVDALGHSYGEWISETEPTCTEDGLKYKLCSACGDRVEEAIPATGHSYTDTVVAPTCTEQGYTKHTCSECGNNYTDSYVDALGHSYGEWAVEIEPTCTEDGLKYKLCSACGDRVEEAIPATGHSYTDTVVAPTCTEQGYTKHTCSECGNNYTDSYVDPVGHSYGEWAVETEPTCTEDGLKYKLCSVCGDRVEEAIPATGHSYTDTVVAPTCTEQGYTKHTCSKCGDVYIDNYVDATGHNYKDTVIAPTCTEQGYTNHTCTVCSHSFNDTYTSATGHSYVQTVVAPTCTAVGYTQYVCSVCGHSYKDNYTEATGHNFVVTVVAPTCTKEGYTVHQCSVCNYSFRDNFVGPVDHNYISTVTEPTCTEQGYTTHVCSYCNHSYTDSYTPSKGHSYGDWIVDKTATVLEEGLRHRICQECGSSWEETINRVEIDINTNTDYGQANFTVVNAQTLEPIANANIYIKTENDGENVFTTDKNGKVSVILPVGAQNISVYCDGYITRNIKVKIKSGVNNIPKVGLSDMPTYSATVTHKVMTIDEIEQAGIDTSNPDNRHVFKYEVKLEFTPGIDWLSFFYYMNDGGEILGGGSGSGGAGGSGSGGIYASGGYWVSSGGGNGAGGGSGYFYVPRTDLHDSMTIFPASEYFYLIIRGEVRWLKEMFDVEMLIVNNSMTDTLEDLSATLNLPDGLSLAAMTGEQQTETQEVGNVPEGGSKSVHWYVRGDKEGSYKIEARLQGMVMPFEEEIDDLFVAENELQVLAGSAMNLHLEFPDAAYYGDDYPITVTLTNVSDRTLYNVSHLIQIEQGMEVYYSDGTSEKRVETTQFNGIHELREFNPGDKIVIKASVNIFFKSAAIEQRLESMIGFVDNMEHLVKSYKAVKTGFDLISGVSNCISNCSNALNDFIVSDSSVQDSKFKLFKELYTEISGLMTSYSSSGNGTIDAATTLANSGITKTFDAITNDPGEWLVKHSISDIYSLMKNVKRLTNSITKSKTASRKFNIFDSLRTAISAIPVSFMLTNVIVTEDENNTTSIPLSYSVTKAEAQYNGVSNYSKYITSLVQAAAGEIYDDTMPGIFRLIPGLDDPLNKDEAIRYIQATEDEITKFKAKAADGNVKFKVWVERKDVTLASLLGSDDDNFVIECDNDSASYENNILTFTGDANISVTPKSLTDGILHIEDSNGNAYVYDISVVEKHTCTAGSSEVVIPSTDEYDGFAVKCCETCGEVLEVQLLTAEDACTEHSFGEWTVESEPTCSESGIKSRICSVCGKVEEEFIPTVDHTCETWTLVESPTCSEEGVEKSVCSVCGEEAYRAIEKTAHKGGMWITEKESTCSEDGVAVEICSVCHEKLERHITIPATGHQWSEWVTTLNPTVTSTGLMQRICSVCGEKEEIIIPKLIPNFVSSVKISSEKATLAVGDTLTLNVTVLPDTATNKNVKWSSSNAGIVSVDNGVITANKPGTAIITVETEDCGYKDFCFVRVAGIVASTGSNAVIDYSNAYIFGVEPHLLSLDGFVETVDENQYLQYSDGTLGTGSTVSVIEDGNQVDEYTVVVFGDVNGDGWYDGTDAITVSCLASGMLTREQVGEAVWMAADCNHDGVIDQLDVDLLNQAGVLLANIDQTKSEEELKTDSEYAEYLSLIDQQVDIPQEETTEDAPTPDDIEPLSAFIRFVIAIIKRIFAVIGIF